MTFGDRLSNGTYAEENKRAFHGFGNDLVRCMIKWIYGYSFDDVMTDYHAMSKPFIKTSQCSLRASRSRWSYPSTPSTIAGASKTFPLSNATDQKGRSPSSIQ